MLRGLPEADRTGHKLTHDAPSLHGTMTEEGGAVGCWVGLFRLSLRSCMVQSEPGGVLQTLGQPGHHTPVLPHHGDSNDQPRPDAEGWREEVDGVIVSSHTEPPPDGQYFKPDKQTTSNDMHAIRVLPPPHNLKELVEVSINMHECGGGTRHWVRRRHNCTPNTE